MSGGRPEKLGTGHTTLENAVEPCVGDTMHDCHEVDPTLWEQFSCPLPAAGTEREIGRRNFTVADGNPMQVWTFY
jgi:hypothetical protein